MASKTSETRYLFFMVSQSFMLITPAKLDQIADFVNDYSTLRTHTGAATSGCAVKTLGWPVLRWLTEHSPSTSDSSEPFVLADEQVEVVLQWYEPDHEGRFVQRRGAWQGAKGLGKSPVGAGLAIAGLRGLCGSTVGELAASTLPGQDKTLSPVQKQLASMLL